MVFEIEADGWVELFRLGRLLLAKKLGNEEAVVFIRKAEAKLELPHQMQ
jgi:hypothetical protein